MVYSPQGFALFSPYGGLNPAVESLCAHFHLAGTLKEDIGSVCMDLNKLHIGSRDAISCLPQEVLVDILSLLPTKLAVSTSLLSKRWRHVFRSVHTLDLNCYSFPRRQNGKMIRECFRNFVERTLALQCGSPIKKFSLTYQIFEDMDVANVRRWICNVLERCVLEVDLRLTPGRDQGLVYPVYHVDEVHGDCLLPCHLFRSKTLVKLSLGTNIEIGKLPTDVSLPALKSLYMDTIGFDDNGLNDVLLPGCPMLEELTVGNVMRKQDPCSISSPSIKKLTILYSYEYDCDYMSFDAPSLVSLDYSDYALYAYPLVNLGSLVDAKLSLWFPEIERFKRPDLTDLIIGISNVQTLHLYVSAVDVISDCVDHGLVLPVFKNLVKLFFGTCNQRCRKLLPYLLKQSPKVETLTIEGLVGDTCDVTIGLLQVKVLDVLCYKGSAKEFEHLKSLLKGNECMERVRVEFSESAWWMMTLLLKPVVV